MSRRYVLVGSGIAALAAAEAIRERDLGATITVVSDEPHPFYSRPGLAYLLDRSLPEASLRLRTPAELEALELERIQGRAVRLRPADHQIDLDDGRSLRYDRLLLATGAASIAAPFPGGTLAGVVRLDGLDGAREIARRARPGLIRGRRWAVVIGGGSTALEIVEGLAARGVETHYLLRGDRYWSRVLAPGESAAIEDRLRAHGVALHHQAGIARAEGRRGALREVVTEAGERIRCDILAVAIGVRPRLELAAAAGVAVDRGIRVDERLRTSAPDVFAAGDVAEVEGAGLDTLWKSALWQGRTAGAGMAGGAAVYRREVALNVTRLAGITTTVIGAVGGDPDPDLLTLTRGQSERWRRSASDRELTFGRGVDRVRVHVGERRVTGALVMGDQAPSEPLTRLIRDEVDLGALRTRLEAAPDRALDLLLAAGGAAGRAGGPGRGWEAP